MTSATEPEVIGPVPAYFDEFILALGVALLRSGYSVADVHPRLRAVIDAYGVKDLSLSVLPNLVLIDDGRRTRSRTVDMVGQHRMDQAMAVVTVLRSAQSGDITPQEGLRALAQALAMPRRFPEWVSFIGYAAMAAGFALMFGASLVGVALAFGLGLGVGLIMHVARPYPVLMQLLPPLIAFLTSLVVFAVGGVQDGLEPARLVAAPLVALIPGMALTAGTLELAGGHIISGASRLVWGVMQLVLIASGIVAGAYAARVDAWNPSDQGSASSPAWFALLGVLVVAIGQLLYFNEPAGIVKWLLPLLLLAFIIQTIAGVIVGSIASGGVAAAIILPIALQIERRRRGSAPPALITFQPVFWLLVPGSLGVLGLTEALINGMGGNTDLSAAGFLFAMAGGILAIVLGTQIGSLIGWAFTRVTEVVPDMVLRAVGAFQPDPDGPAHPAPPTAERPAAD